MSIEMDVWVRGTINAVTRHVTLATSADRWTDADVRVLLTEMLLAIAPFEVFVGMRPPEQVAELTRRLDVPRLRRMAERAAAEPDPCRALLAAVLATPADRVADLARQVVAACVRLSEDRDEIGAAAAAVVDVAEMHPDDIGLVVLLLMHHRVLAPGDYVDVAAGVLHSYVRGLGIEVLANSDNVVRAGLTTKAVNVPELLRIVDPRATGVPGRARAVAPGVEVYPSASDRFLLHRVEPGRELPPTAGPRIAFCLRGRVGLTSASATLVLEDAESAFLPAGEGAVRLDGVGDVYVVSVPGLDPA